MTRKTALVVSHTHWDREWYSTFEQFRMELVGVVDEMLDLLERKPEFVHFSLDGQTAAIEDYLEIRPQHAERVRKLARAGRLAIGPWYVQPDEFIPSGESLVRNLLTGIADASRIAPPMRVGYCPDSFGHPAQLPQILRGFGMDSFVFHRGMGDHLPEPRTEFWWEAPDGSRVLALYMVLAYGPAAFLAYDVPPAGDDGHEEALRAKLDYVRERVAPLVEMASTEYLLFANGGDHLAAQPQVPEVIAYVNEHLDDVTLVQTSWADAVDLLRKVCGDVLPTVTGELRGGREHFIVPGVMSTRMYLKQANARAQVKLEHWMERWAVASHVLTGAKLDGDFQRYAWKTLLQNHPHDSLCGCSIDAVHDEMLTRFAKAEQVAEGITTLSLQRIAAAIDTRHELEPTARAVVVANPHAWVVSDTVAVDFALPTQPGERLPRFKVVDHAGREVPSQMEDERVGESVGALGIPPGSLTWQFTLRFRAVDVPALGYRTWWVGPRAEDTEPLPVPESLSPTLDNERVRVEVNPNGTLRVHDLRHDRVFDGLMLFEDGADVGDEYSYSPAMHPLTVTTASSHPEVELVQDGPVSRTLRIRHQLQVPAAATADHFGRGEETVMLSIESFVTLADGSPRVDVRTVVDNNARDHRLRVLFPLPFRAEEHHAEQAFHVLRRPALEPESEGWVEPPPGTHAQQRFCAATAADYGLAIANSGLPEYELNSDQAAGSTLALTLLRCVGWMGREGGLIRRKIAGLKVETPGAQCLGRHEFRYSICPMGEEPMAVGALRPSHEHDVALRAVLVDQHDGPLPSVDGLVDLEPATLVVTTVKPSHHDTGDVIVRFYNAADEPATARLRFGRPVTAARGVSLGELDDDARPLEVNGDTVTTTAGAHEIVTIAVRLVEADGSLETAVLRNMVRPEF